MAAVLLVSSLYWPFLGGSFSDYVRAYTASSSQINYNVTEKRINYICLSYSN